MNQTLRIAQDSAKPGMRNSFVPYLSLYTGTAWKALSEAPVVTVICHVTYLNHKKWLSITSKQALFIC